MGALVTSNSIQRTLLIKKGNSLGTAFTVDRNSRQYIVTARHVVAGVQGSDAIEIRHEGQWKNAQVEVVGVGQGPIDVTVLRHAHRLTPTLPLEPSGAGLAFGQRVAFLGFPFGWNMGAENLNNGYPMPFVKAGIVSAMLGAPMHTIYLDAHGNRGFSGGPLLFSESGPSTTPKVAGVICSAPPDPETKEHAGFVRAISIGYATEMIDSDRT